MIALRYILSALIVLMMAACGPSGADRSRLDRAEALVRDYPDSALAVLDSITPASLSHADFRARTDICRAEAAYKLRQPLPSDSAFAGIIATLSRKEPGTALVRAYFLSGYRKIGEERYVDAIVDLLTAEDIALALGDVHFAALAQRNIADAFDNMDDKASALEYYQKSAETFRADPDSMYYFWGLYNVARAYNNVLEYGRAVELIDSIADIEAVRNNKEVFPHVLAMQALAHLNIHQNSRAIELFQTLKNTDYVFTALNYYHLGAAYLNLNMIDEAWACSDSVKVYNPSDTNLDYAIARRTKDARQIFQLIDNDFNYTNSEFESVYKRNYSAVIDGFYKQAIAERKAELSHSRRGFTTFAVIVLAVLVLVIIVAAILVRRKQLRINKTLGLVAELSESLHTKSDRITELSGRLTEVSDNLNSASDRLAQLSGDLAEGSRMQAEYRRQSKEHVLKQLAAFNDVCGLYSDSADNPKQLYKRVEAFISRHATPQNLAEIEQDINEYFDNIISRLRSDFPALKQTDVHLFTLIVAGFKAPAIALYLGADINAIYTRKFRLKQKLLKTNPSAAQHYITYLS